MLDRSEKNVEIFRDSVERYSRFFETIEYAVFCRGYETQNYDAFCREFQLYE
ncbi:MAG: hypothetical protein ACI4FY_01735 [Acetatifactor sp.]